MMEAAKDLSARKLHVLSQSGTFLHRMSVAGEAEQRRALIDRRMTSPGALCFGPEVCEERF